MTVGSIVPPSDSLYKFIAVSGVILLLSALVLIDRSEERLALAMAEFVPEAERVIADYETSHDYFLGFQRRIDESILANALAIALYHAHEEKPLDPDAKYEVFNLFADSIIEQLEIDVHRDFLRAESSLVAQLGEFQSINTLSEFADSAHAVADSLYWLFMRAKAHADSIRQAARPSRERITVFQRRYRKDFWIAVPTGLFGFLLMLIGFRLWFVKVQRFQDIVARRNAVVASRDI